jgi:hypothetical protein
VTAIATFRAAGEEALVRIGPDRLWIKGDGLPDQRAIAEILFRWDSEVVVP